MPQRSLAHGISPISIPDQSTPRRTRSGSNNAKTNTTTTSFPTAIRRAFSGRRSPSPSLPTPVHANTPSFPEHSRSGSRSSPFPSVMSSYSWWRVKRTLSRPLPWMLIMLFALIIWWSKDAKHELQSPEMQSRLREIFPPEITEDLQFYPASNRKIHYVGRWTAAPNRLRIDGAFPGVYFDLNVTNTSSVLLSLQNAKPESISKPVTVVEHLAPGELPDGETQFSQYSFTSASKHFMPAPPVSLIALVDGEEYVILPSASSLVSVRMHDMNPRQSHTIRVIAPMIDNDGIGIVQLDGIWLDKGGLLSPVEGSAADFRGDEEDDLDPESSQIGKTHRLGLANMLHRFNRGEDAKDSDDEESDIMPDLKRRRKLIEIITDQPAHMTNRLKIGRSGGADGLLSGVMGWEYLLGEMFSVDHVCVGAEGTCLIHDCIGGTGAPSGMGDVFFRSGPVGSTHYGHPWPFQSYVPDVIILNLGASDFYSFDNNMEEYNKTGADLWRSFEDTYVSLVKAIRNLAYTTHPSVLEMQRLGLDDFADYNAPATIPIFIMRPFNGELEHATQGTVLRLREEGDKGVFWLDTTGWLDMEDTESTASDFFDDPHEDHKHPHLTERGNQKVAIYLHMHVCRYLAADDEKCAFLPPEVYQGNVYDPTVATFDRYMEKEKEQKLRELYWEDESRVL